MNQDPRSIDRSQSFSTDFERIENRAKTNRRVISLESILDSNGRMAVGVPLSI